jgi:hypothetical protein
VTRIGTLLFADWGAKRWLATLLVAAVLAMALVVASNAKTTAMLLWVVRGAKLALATLLVPTLVATAADMAGFVKRRGLLPCVGWGARLSLATLLVATILSTAAVMADSANATPIYNACYDAGNEVAYYEWSLDEHGKLTDAIYINDCALAAMGAGPTDYDRVLAHELGHAQGLEHNYDDSYDLMYPQMLIGGY